jgi:hypothetical protein
MATTTNYGWTTPDDTALVKDGASAIRTLGSSVDTTTKNLNPETTLGDISFRSSTSNVNTRLGIGSAGQVLTIAAGIPSWATPAGGAGMTFIDEETFTSVSSVSFNNVFTSTYAHYYITFNYVGTIADATRIRLRASGSDNTTSNYSSQKFEADGTGTTISRATSNDKWNNINISTNGDSGEFTIFNPQTALKTSGYAVGSYNGSDVRMQAFSQFFNATTSFDGFTLFPSSGNFTGTIRVYGLANS